MDMNSPALAGAALPASKAPHTSSCATVTLTPAWLVTGLQLGMGAFETFATDRQTPGLELFNSIYIRIYF